MIEHSFPDLLDADEMVRKYKKDLDVELAKTMKDSLESRRCTFRALCLQWHGSRHEGRPSARWAGRVHQHLMAQRDWYLQPSEDTVPNLAADMRAARASLNHTYGD